MQVRISKCVAFTGLAKCGGVRRGNGAKRNDLAERSLAARTGRRTVTVCYVQCTFYIKNSTRYLICFSLNTTCRFVIYSIKLFSVNTFTY